MTNNYYEYRLKQIEILLNAFNDDKQYKDEIDNLNNERWEILEHIKFKD